MAASATNAAMASCARSVFGRGSFVSARQFIEGSQLRIELGIELGRVVVERPSQRGHQGLLARGVGRQGAGIGGNAPRLVALAEPFQLVVQEVAQQPRIIAGPAALAGPGFAERLEPRIEDVGPTGPSGLWGQGGDRGEIGPEGEKLGMRQSVVAGLRRAARPENIEVPRPQPSRRLVGPGPGRAIKLLDVAAVGGIAQGLAPVCRQSSRDRCRCSASAGPWGR